MKKHGILNPHLNAGLARLGHGDLLVIADCGLPLPLGAPIVDLALTMGVPGFVQVFDAVLGELVVDSCVVASECLGTKPDEWVSSRISAVESVPHEEFKLLTPRAKLIVRSGEATPYANVALRCGVPF
ncbi:D-ribose pyranase [Sinomonas sp. P47F7]|uniref:D-ribose pyranase n=1 Tax=Sinomonas sp. P47F7 TaxID=3410987 RepID=UPI003BF4921E